MKKFIVATLCLAMSLSFVACGDTKNKSDKDEVKATENIENSSEEGNKEGNGEAGQEPSTVYDLCDGKERTEADFSKMFDCWGDDFDNSIVAEVKAEGCFVYIECDDDGKISDKDITNISVRDKNEMPIYQIPLDLSNISESEIPENEEKIYIEGIWKKNPDSQDLSDFRIFVDKIEKR